MRAKLPPGSPLKDRIAALVSIDENGCWNWLAKIDRHGYGHITVAGKDFLAHRASYESHRGAIPEGLTLDHLCRNTKCCNPSHLEPVTVAENNRRGDTIPGINARKTHCNRGHELSGSNLRIYKGLRVCKACDRIRTASHKRRNMEARQS